MKLDVPRATWFELFYDLVVAASITIATAAVVVEPTWATTGWIFEILLVVFSLWLLTTIAGNLTISAKPLPRMLVLVQMLAIVVAALALGTEANWPAWQGALALAVAFATVGFLYAVHAGQGQAARRDTRVIAGAAFVSAAVMLVAAMATRTTDGNSRGLLAAALAVAVAIVMVPVLGPYLQRWRADALDEEHLSERVGALVIIVIGETFFSLATKLETKSYIPSWLFFVLAFLLAFSFWRIYFTSVEPVGIPADPRRARWWLLAHVLVVLGIVASAAAFTAWTIDDGATTKSTAWTPVPIVSAAIGFMVLTWLAKAPVAMVRVHAVASVALVALSITATAMPQGGAELELILGACVMLLDAFAVALIARRMHGQLAAD